MDGTYTVGSPSSESWVSHFGVPDPAPKLPACRSDRKPNRQTLPVHCHYGGFFSGQWHRNTATPLMSDQHQPIPIRAGIGLALSRSRPCACTPLEAFGARQDSAAGRAGYDGHGGANDEEPEPTETQVSDLAGHHLLNHRGRTAFDPKRL